MFQPIARRPWLMLIDTPPAPGGAAPEPPASATAEPPADPPADPPTPPSPNDQRVVAELAAERKRRQALQSELDKLSGVSDVLKQLAGKASLDDEGTDLERLTRRMTALEAEAATAKVEAMRMRVANDSGISAELAEFLTATDEEGLRAQAAKLQAATAAAGPQRPQPDPAQGGRPQPDAGKELDAQIAQAEKDGNVALSIHLKRQKAALTNAPT